MKKTLLPLSLSLALLNACTQTVSHPHAHTDKFPQAQWHGSSNTEVLSPFAPHHIIDVSGLKPGQHSYDPSTAKITNGKPDLSLSLIHI